MLTPYQIAGLRQKQAMGYELTQEEMAALGEQPQQQPQQVAPQPPVPQFGTPAPPPVTTPGPAKVAPTVEVRQAQANDPAQEEAAFQAGFNRIRNRDPYRFMRRVEYR